MAYQYEVNSIIEGIVVPIAGIGWAASLLAEAAVLTIIGIALLIIGTYVNRRYPGGFKVSVGR